MVCPRITRIITDYFFLTQRRKGAKKGRVSHRARRVHRERACFFKIYPCGPCELCEIYLFTMKRLKGMRGEQL